MSAQQKIMEAMAILKLFGLPRAQYNNRSALCLLALLNLSPDKEWASAENPLVGITPIMDWSKANYGITYAANTRETFRRQTMHQFIEAGIALYNPDNPTRSVNSPKAVYQIEPSTLELLRLFGTRDWDLQLTTYLSERRTLTDKYAMERDLQRIPLKVSTGLELTFSPGKHSELIRDIVEKFGPHFIPGGILIYAGDTGSERYLNEDAFAKLGVRVDSHGKMPDVIIYYPDMNWLILAEAVTSHGPVDGKRHSELKQLFAECTADLVYLTAFPDRNLMARYVSQIAWETEVWCADSPTHLIHFNGERFLGPYADADNN
jgi:hypothetical protein